MENKQRQAEREIQIGRDKLKEGEMEINQRSIRDQLEINRDQQEINKRSIGDQ